MSNAKDRPPQAGLPAVDKVMREAAIGESIAAHGRDNVVSAVRATLAAMRATLAARQAAAPSAAAVARAAMDRLGDRPGPAPRPVINLTGTVLHTNLGRALLPAEAIAAMSLAASAPCDLEYDLESGARGDRDAHVEALLRQLTGAEAATVVNNNAAAVLLVLNALALRRQVPVSRGELVEIGGSFRMPDIMKRAGCRLVEVGTTNRTHLADYEDAVTAGTALLMKVHPSNYAIGGYTAGVAEPELAALAHRHNLPLVSDLGAGALLDLRRWGLPYEPTPAGMIAAGVDIVTFSGDKLLGGPQAGLIVGKAALIARIKRNPLRRALRPDKVMIAALAAVLQLYTDPDRLARRLPTLRALTRAADDIAAQAARLLPAVQRALGGRATVSIVSCDSQAGSGALPSGKLPSHALQLSPAGTRRERTARAEALAAEFRALPVPVIGRVHDGALLFDLRCLDDEAQFLAQLTNPLPSGEGASKASG